MPSLPPPPSVVPPFPCVCSYALLPYLYTQFLAANASGAPIMRPLFYEFPEEAGIFETQHTFMLGEPTVKWRGACHPRRACARCSPLLSRPPT